MLKMLNNLTTKKVKGASVQSIIIGSIILGIIAGAGVSTMWDSVERAKVVAEKATIGEVQVALQGLLQENSGSISQVTTTEQATMKSRISFLPSTFQYNLIRAEDGSNNSAIAIVAGAVTTDTGAVSKLKEMVVTLDEQIDGGDGATTGNFTYSTTCTDEADCYYSMYSINNGMTNTVFQTNILGSVNFTGAKTANDAITNYTISYEALN